MIAVGMGGDGGWGHTGNPAGGGGGGGGGGISLLNISSFFVPDVLRIFFDSESSVLSIALPNNSLYIARATFLRANKGTNGFSSSGSTAGAGGAGGTSATINGCSLAALGNYYFSAGVNGGGGGNSGSAGSGLSNFPHSHGGGGGAGLRTAGVVNGGSVSYNSFVVLGGGADGNNGAPGENGIIAPTSSYSFSSLNGLLGVNLGGGGGGSANTTTGATGGKGGDGAPGCGGGGGGACMTGAVGCNTKAGLGGPAFAIIISW